MAGGSSATCTQPVGSLANSSTGYSSQLHVWDDQLGAAGRFDVRGLLTIGRTKSADALLSSIGGRP